MISLTVNGSPKQFEAAITLTQLLDVLKLTGQRIAVERNGEIVPRSLYAGTQLSSGDTLEIVLAVGGG